MIEQLPTGNDRILGFRLSGKLHDDDYKTFIPIVESAVETHGKVRMLTEFHEFHGWDMPALWDDIKFAAKHCNDIERIAMVGEKAWQEWMAKICKPFTMAKIEYFNSVDIDAAWKWLRLE